MKSAIQADLPSALAAYSAFAEDTTLQVQIAELADWCLDPLRQGGSIPFAGNGSFADSQHLAAEFVSRL